MIATVRPLPGRCAPVAIKQSVPPGRDRPTDFPKPSRRASPAPGPQAIEPGRLRRISRRPPAGLIDLHGLSQDEARAALGRFLEGCFHNGVREALLITGKGALGDGVLRKRLPEWLAEPPLRDLVAGISMAHPRHGGAGAFYVALKRRMA